MSKKIKNLKFLSNSIEPTNVGEIRNVNGILKAKDSNGIFNIIPQTSGMTTSNVQIFTSNSTWTKPSGASIVMVYLIGGGGGGGAGFTADSGIVATGGAGGGSGGMIWGHTLIASQLPNIISVVVGQGGQGGQMSGQNGSSGGFTMFDTLIATGGAGGEGGSSGTSNNPTQFGEGSINGMYGNARVSSSYSYNIVTLQQAQGGASGKGINSSNIIEATWGSTTSPSTTVASSRGTLARTTQNSHVVGWANGGYGGSGGSASITGNAGAGEDGGLYGGGGGGGGASRTGFLHGQGGSGAAGIAVIFSW